MEVKIRTIETEGPIPFQTQDLKVNLENVECIGDLKKKLQPLLSVAACDMSVYYKTSVSGQKLADTRDDTERLSSLHVQEGDTFVVEFISVCNMSLLDKVLDKMRTFVKEVCEEFPEIEIELINQWKFHGRYLRIVRYFLVFLDANSVDMFKPWNHKPTNANRHYFAQAGGLEMLASIYKFASKNISKDLVDPHSDAFYEFTKLQRELERLCLQCIRNFSERKQDRQIVLKTFGVDLFICSLLKHEVDDVYDIHPLINEAANGCLAQIAELLDAKQILAENEQALEKLLWITSYRSNCNIHYKEVAAGTLFCCSSHPKAATKIVKNQSYRLVLEKAKGMMLPTGEQHSTPAAVSYFLCLFLANIQTLPEEDLLFTEEEQYIDQILEDFLHLVSPSEIGTFHELRTDAHITLVPFLQLALSGPRNERPQSWPKDPLGSNSETESPYHKPSSSKSHTNPYIFSSTGKLGLFCLCHLMDAHKNRELLKKEKLVDYLVCVCWFARQCPEVVELTPKLEGFEQLEPPHLQSIAKAYLAKCFGQKITWENL